MQHMMFGGFGGFGGYDDDDDDEDGYDDEEANVMEEIIQEMTEFTDRGMKCKLCVKHFNHDVDPEQIMEHLEGKHPRQFEKTVDALFSPFAEFPPQQPKRRAKGKSSGDSKKAARLRKSRK